ncbi:MAG TPA: glycerophosphodiester phosphodiesterase family protein [Vicinamibacterales bacterium]|nr:glycerophosphodiester phosphodiesterase family protein [Vicinamibacterales bacterium]
MHSTITATLLAAMLGMSVAAAAARQQPVTPKTPWLIAHRGASAYAPENTVPAFTLAAEQKAVFVEFDLQLTKDRQIVCLHDNSLERTTDVEEVFPDRYRQPERSQTARRWMLEDFTLAEIKRLDAGSWFDAKFRGTRIPTFGETIDALRGRSGLFIELKSPERYPGIEKLILSELDAKGLGRPGADAKTPVLLQSFNAPSLQILAGLGTKLPIHFLIAARDAGPWMTSEGLQKMKAFSTGISPEKVIVGQYGDAMARARQLGFLITPYTFRASAVATGFADVRAEMAHYLDTLAVDGVITDNPDLWPAPKSR